MDAASPDNSRQETAVAVETRSAFSREELNKIEAKLCDIASETERRREEIERRYAMRQLVWFVVIGAACLIILLVSVGIPVAALLLFSFSWPATGIAGLAGGLLGLIPAFLFFDKWEGEFPGNTEYSRDHDLLGTWYQTRFDEVFPPGTHLRSMALYTLHEEMFGGVDLLCREKTDLRLSGMRRLITDTHSEWAEMIKTSVFGHPSSDT